MTRPRDRRRASALQRSLEAYERMLAEGRSPAEAQAAIAPSLERLGPHARRMFLLAAGLKQAPRPAVEPSASFQIRVANLIRSGATPTGSTRRVRTAPRRRLGLAPLAAAAGVAVFAALLVPAMASLPGDRLYGLKGFSEDARLVFASGTTEARLRVDLAVERFDEVERLIDRSQLSAVGTFAAAATSIDDARLVALIESTLEEAGAHLEKAAGILTTRPAFRSDLDELVDVARRGHRLATDVADDLSSTTKPPVLSTVVKLAKIEAAAKAARTKAKPDAPLPLCAPATPSPSPSPSSSPQVDQTATPTAVEATATPSPTPSATPVATPCISPSPSPTPTPTLEPVQPTTEPSATPDVDEGVGDAHGGDGPSDGHRPGTQAGGSDAQQPA